MSGPPDPGPKPPPPSLGMESPNPLFIDMGPPAMAPIDARPPEMPPFLSPCRQLTPTTRMPRQREHGTYWTQMGRLSVLAHETPACGEGLQSSWCRKAAGCGLGLNFKPLELQTSKHALTLVLSISRAFLFIRSLVSWILLCISTLYCFSAALSISVYCFTCAMVTVSLYPHGNGLVECKDELEGHVCDTLSSSKPGQYSGTCPDMETKSSNALSHEDLQQQRAVLVQSFLLACTRLVNRAAHRTGRTLYVTGLTVEHGLILQSTGLLLYSTRAHTVQSL